MAKKTLKPEKKKTVETLTHEEASRKNIPTAEFQSVMHKEEQSPVRVAYERRNRDLDPQLVWRGKDEQDWSDLVTHAAPIYIQEKVHPKVLIDDLLRRSAADRKSTEDQIDLFADFNGVPEGNAKTEFYQHDANWTNRMILGDSLQVMASLAEREGLREQVQCIYIDPPYGIKFNSNFQWSTTSRDVRDGNAEHITREPEQVKAFRDTWRDGVHSYLTYLRDRLTVARDLLADSGSVFIQIGDENVHRVRGLAEEVFGADNFIAQIQVKKSGGATSQYLSGVTDFVLWYAKRQAKLKYRPVYVQREPEGKGGGYSLLECADGSWQPATPEQLRLGLKNSAGRLLQLITLTSQRQGRDTGPESAMGFPIHFEGNNYLPARNRGWTTTSSGIDRLKMASRIGRSGRNIRYKRYFDDFSVLPTTDFWDDMQSGSAMDKLYVVQTSERVIERCILMATDPGDLVLDPTCGSGTTAYVAEQWGRRWITIDTSRVALALARARIMGARYSYYLLADSKDGHQKEAELTKSVPSEAPAHGDIRQGFVYERVAHVTLKSIANNAEIDVIWERFQGTLDPLREQLNRAMEKTLEEWEVPHDAEDAWDSETQELFYELKAEQARDKKDNAKKIRDCLKTINHNLKCDFSLETLPTRPADPWPEPAQKLHAEWWQQRIARQKEIDASIAAKADFEYLYDKPYDDKRKVRVAGPFTVESLSPHRVLAVDENDELIDRSKSKDADEQDFIQMILENLKTAGVQQAHKEDKITFSSITPWPGRWVCAEGRYLEGGTASGTEKRAAILIGPEFGTVSRPDLVEAAREAGDAAFDVLVACAFNYDARSTDFDKLGRIPILKARMNADLHMADDLKNTGKGNLFVIFGEPDIDILNATPKNGIGQIQVKVNGVDVFHPNTGEVRSDGAEGIACWFIDTDYNEESFFVRHAYFLGANDPYKSLKTTLKAEINEEAWATLNSDTSRPFDKPKFGRIAVKVINHLGDEVMKVFRVG
jgi:adenine-specific DNA-methyltransferase